MTWPMVALNKVLRPSSDRIALVPDTSYKQITAKLWGKGLTLRGTVTGAEIAASYQNRVRAGQFVISKIDARHGAFGVVPSDLDGAVVSNDFPIFDVEPEHALTEYVSWVSRTDWFVALCKQASEGSTNRVRLKEARFLRQTIPLPSLPEQGRIVARLNTASAAVGRIQALRTEIGEDLASLVIRSNETYGAQPTQLADALVLDEDRVAVAPDTIYPQVGIRGFGGGLFRKGGVTAADTTYRHFNRLSAGQFVVSQVKGWEGAVAICDDESAGLFASPEYRTFRCNPAKLNPRYFAHLCRTSWFHAKLAPATRGQGARRERLRPEMLLAIKIPLPPVEVQDRLVPLFDRVATAAAKSGTSDLDHLLPAMLDDVFDAGVGA
ncbi:restriction endonuclease subunit S [Sphingomonas spermidinifaciens]|uniref:restriction endonuclease subunit S n=1 Tax=Sphingomonas spermidinifaciens TaxID=1141889 RepID=UPI0011444A5F|nr:restriction endonuclease subunit S [Sphingomonas spermidinifaciens]